MTHVRRVRLPEGVAAQATILAGGDSARAGWMRDVWLKRSDGRMKPLSDEHEELRVKIDDELMQRIQRAAERAGMPVEAWMRRAIEAEIGYRAVWPQFWSPA